MAVSVLCKGRKPDWNFQKLFLKDDSDPEMQQLLSKLKKIENWAKDGKIIRVAPGFLSLGVITATLKDEDTTPEVRDERIISVTISNREDKQALTR